MLFYYCVFNYFRKLHTLALINNFILVKLIVCLTGMPGSGKSTIVSVLKSKGIETLNLGDGVRAEAKRRNLEPSGENLGKIMLELREKNGPGAIANLLTDQIQNSQSNIIIIEDRKSVV